LIYPVDEAALKAARNQEYLSLFKILKQGRLAEQLKHELDDPMGVFHELIDQPFFAKADEAMTAAYGKRLSEIRPSDLGRITRLQNEMWRAWLRLWGISTWRMIRKSGHRFSLATNARRLRGDHAQTKAKARLRFDQSNRAFEPRRMCSLSAPVTRSQH
jgi:hypothetical protein